MLFPAIKLVKNLFLNLHDNLIGHNNLKLNINCRISLTVTYFYYKRFSGLHSCLNFIFPFIHDSFELTGQVKIIF